MKHYVLCLGVLSMVLGVSVITVSADVNPSAVFHIDGASIQPEDVTADVFIRLTDIILPTADTDGISGLQFRLKYDATKLSATTGDVSTTPLTADWLLVSNIKDSEMPGFKEVFVAMVHFSLAGPAGLTQEGQVVQITLGVLPDFTSGSTELELLPLRERLINPKAGTATVAEPGQVQIAGAPTPEEVTAMSQFNQFNATFNRRTGEFSIMVNWTNIGAEALLAPLRMIIDNVTPPIVTVINAGDITPERKPFYDFSNFVLDARLAPGETSVARQLVFNNPDRLRFTFDARFEAIVERNDGAAPLLRAALLPDQPTPIRHVVPMGSSDGRS